MKYLVLLCDGMADYPCEKLDGKTPMQAAKRPIWIGFPNTPKSGW